MYEFWNGFRRVLAPASRYNDDKMKRACVIAFSGEGDMRRSVYFLALACLLLAACDTKPAAPPVVMIPPTAKTIAVAVIIPPVLRLETTGLTAFELSTDIVDIPDWQLDKVAANEATAALTPQFTVESATVDAPITIRPLSQIDRWMGAQTDDVGAELRGHIHADRPADLYLVIFSEPEASLRSTGKTTVGNRITIPTLGIGVYKERHILRTLAPQAHVYLLMAVVDGHTFSTLALTGLRMATGRSAIGTTDMPVVPLDNFDWHDDWRDMTAAQHDQIHSQIVSMLTASVGYTIQQIELVPGAN